MTHWRLILGLLCCALVVLAGTLSVAHWHEQDNLTHADCGLCATAHVTVQQVVLLTLVLSVPVFVRVEASVLEARPRTVARSALFTRPPPVPLV